DPARAVGIAVTRGSRLRAAARLVLALACLAVPRLLFAADRYALIVTGASGGESYAQKYQQLRATLTTVLRETFTYPADHLLVLAEEDGVGVQKSTRENVQRVFADLRKRLT